MNSQNQNQVELIDRTKAIAEKYDHLGKFFIWNGLDYKKNRNPIEEQEHLGFSGFYPIDNHRVSSYPEPFLIIERVPHVLVQRSNLQFIFDQYSDMKGLYKIIQDCRSYALGIDARVLLSYPDFQSENLGDLIEDLEYAKKHLLLDEDNFYALEEEIKTEAWEDWAEKKFIQALNLENRDLTIQDHINIENLFQTVSDRHGEYWEVSDLGIAWVNIPAIAGLVTAEDLEEFGFLATDLD